MPGDSQAKHPSGLVINFTEKDHRYVDEFGREYTSGTSLIHRAFPAFNADKVAARVAPKRGVPEEQLKAEWKANGEAASRAGTRMHENAEHQILCKYELLHTPENDEERVRFARVWELVENMKRVFVMMEPEKIVFSPNIRIAGSIDLWARANNHWVIGDYKLIKELKKESFNNECGTVYPTLALPNCNFYQYSLQLSIYELIMRIEGYIPWGEKVERWLFIYDQISQQFKHEPLPFLEKEASQLLLWHLAGSPEELDDIPF